MKRTSLILMLVASSLAMAGRSDELREEPFSFDSTYSQMHVAGAISKALVGRGWQINDRKQGVVKATLRLRAHVVKVRIEYTKTGMTVYYVDSTNMKYKEKRGKRYIHGKYNAWIRNLENDVLVHLSA